VDVSGSFHTVHRPKHYAWHTGMFVIRRKSRTTVLTHTLPALGAGVIRAVIPFEFREDFRHQKAGVPRLS